MSLLSNKTKALTHSLVALFIVTSLDTLIQDLSDGELPHTKLEWHHLIMTSVITGGATVIALLRKSPLTTDIIETKDKPKEQ